VNLVHTVATAISLLDFREEMREKLLNSVGGMSRPCLTNAPAPAVKFKSDLVLLSVLLLCCPLRKSFNSS